MGLNKGMSDYIVSRERYSLESFQMTHSICRLRLDNVILSKGCAKQFQSVKNEGDFIYGT